jgi:hypothetical protein
MLVGRITVREYAPGDRIRFTLIIRHKIAIPDEQGRLWATFYHVGSDQTDLSRVVVVHGRVIDQSMTEEGHKNSHVLFESEPIPVNSAPAGEYRLSSVDVKTYGGTQMSVTGELPKGRFWLTDGEPTDTPIDVEGFYWRDHWRG